MGDSAVDMKADCVDAEEDDGNGSSDEDMSSVGRV